LRKAFDRLGENALKSRPALSTLPLRESLVEILIRFSIMERIEDSTPEALRPLAERVIRFMSPVLTAVATVDDAALAAVFISRLLEAVPNISPDSQLYPSVYERVESQLFENLTDGPALRFDFPADENAPYHPAEPVPYRGQTNPEWVQFELAVEVLEDAIMRGEEVGVPLSKETLMELMAKGAKIKISQMTASELVDSQGLFVADLDGLTQEKIKSLSPDEKKRLGEILKRAQPMKLEETIGARVFYYDEWDYLIEDYKPRWCKLHEFTVEGDSSAVVKDIQKEHMALIASVRRHFQRIRPESLQKINRLPDGEEIELNDAIEAVIDQKIGLTPSDRVYQRKERRRRDVATAFLLDLSASTSESIVRTPKSPTDSTPKRFSDRYDDYLGRAGVGPVESPSSSKEKKRVIDIEREALVIMAEALEGLGDEYAIYGFSGQGRHNVEFLTIKDFSERYSERARRRIGALKARTGTRMGPAIRHTLDKLAETGSRLKVLILLSDGYPQDVDYGPDRMSRDYGLHDTMVALQEARKRDMHTFLVTVDQAGNDYLQEMCAGENYLVVKRPNALPEILPRIYRGLTV
jgi:hypothetical protein